ncbi:MAG TPA: AcrB/AcrD/AcrF family protein, partial [Allosphingosinicella sp.]|nr:AcrB/AcrD/AcrF family protein [Allosphingosinicella sp.]
AVVLAWMSPQSLAARLALAAGAAALTAGFYALAWPHCLGRLEGASPELERLWLSKVREAMPIYKHSWRTMVTVATLPALGLIGYGLMLWRSRRDEAGLIRWAAVAAPALLAVLLLLWQTRAGPAAQLLAVPGAAGLGWFLIGWFRSSRFLLVRIGGPFLALLVVSGMAGHYAMRLVPADKKTDFARRVDEANRKCPTLPALRPIAQLPKGNVLTHVDLGPRLITVTHHNAIAGPYHRNDDDIIAIMRAFRGSAEEARRTVAARKIDYVLVCPNLSETTIYSAEAPNGFYRQLVKGKVPAWLEPIPLPKGSPYRMWRVRRGS